MYMSVVELSIVSSFLLGASINFSLTRKVFAVGNVADVNSYISLPFVARLCNRTTTFDEEIIIYQV